MEPETIRALFRATVGSQVYGKFVRAVNTTCRREGRLLYWQEQVWNDFVGRHPEITVVSAAVLGIFSVCEVHGDTLREETGTTEEAAVRDTPEYRLAQEQLFPYCLVPVRAEVVARGDIRVVEAWYCAACRAARARWTSEHAELASVLRRRTTYLEYMERWLDGYGPISAAMVTRIHERSAAIEAEMYPGDELWEWDAGGWDRLAGRSGLAIVRGGRIIKQWVEWKS